MVLGAACAVVQEPPGGPPDLTPPTVVRVVPDSGAVLERLSDPARIEFDEIIDEGSGGGLGRLIRLSPRPRQLDVKWGRSVIEVRPAGGWRRDVIYHLTLLPGVQDLRRNRLDSGRTIIFSTGGPIPDTRLSGTVLDWEGGRAATGALIEAVALPDSLVYTGQADSAGEFALGALPRGRYLVFGVLDQNRNGERDAREAFDSTTLTLDTTAQLVLWTYTQDTIGPVLRGVTRVDSVTLRLEFGRRLAPGSEDAAAVRVDALPDTVPIAVRAVWTQARYDSVRTAEGAPRTDTAGADTAAVPAAPPAPPPRPAAADTTRQRADTTAAQRLLAQRPPLGQVWIVRLGAPLAPGGRYLVRARATSVAGAAAESRSVLVLPARRDST